jgi:hypothetical protein
MRRLLPALTLASALLLGAALPASAQNGEMGYGTGMSIPGMSMPGMGMPGMGMPGMGMGMPPMGMPGMGMSGWGMGMSMPASEMTSCGCMPTMETSGMMPMSSMGMAGMMPMSSMGMAGMGMASPYVSSAGTWGSSSFGLGSRSGRWGGWWSPWGPPPQLPSGWGY